MRAAATRGSWEPGAGNWEPSPAALVLPRPAEYLCVPLQPAEAGSREPGAGSRSVYCDRAAATRGSWELGAGSWEPIRLLRAQRSNDGLQGLDDLVAIDARLPDPELQPERFGRRLVAEGVVLRPAGPGLGGLFFFADGLAGCATAGRDPLDKRNHFGRVALPNYLQKQ